MTYFISRVKRPNSFRRLLLESIFQVAELGNYRLNEELSTTQAFIDYTERYNNSLTERSTDEV